jgi:Flp pilus assembly protein TadG
VHRIVTRLRRRSRDRDERGAIAIIMAVSLTLLLVAAAMALDFGLVRVDRQVDKSAADSATLAGLHALGSTGDGSAHAYLGVCTAVRYLQSNSDRFAGINESTGWTNGLGAATGNGCSDVTLRNQKCVPSNKATWAGFRWSGTWQGMPLSVTVESGYSLSGSNWAEDSLAASSADTGDPTQRGCDQLAVTVTQSRRPGLGSIATSSDLVTSIRSVGRVKPVPGKSAPALLLLQRSGCPVLRAGNSGGGSGTYIHVLGVLTSYGTSQPGTIHADSDGIGCTGGSNSNVFVGAQNDGIVAYAAPLVGSPTQPDPAKPGSITSVAASNGAAASIVRDSLDYVYGSTALSSGGTKQEVSGRSLIGRALVDQRYFPAVKTALTGASAVFAAGASGPPATWTKFPASVNACKPTQAQVNALGLAAGSSLYIDCSGKFVGDAAGLSIPAGRVYFRGWVNPGGLVQLPNADHVYIGNHGDNPDAISLGTGSSFEMHTNGNLSGGLCSDGQSTSKAVLFVRSGDFKESGNGTILRLCRTTAFMMGGRSDGCVPLTEGTAPTSTPCAGVSSGLGNGQLTQQGGDIDWTPPDAVAAALDPVTQAPTAAALAAWGDANGPEDLALWSESASDTSTTYNMNGSGLFHVRGIYMVPNAAPFKLSGGAGMTLDNAQYIVTSIELNGGTQITMRVNPDSAVTLPDLGLVGLVR